MPASTRLPNSTSVPSAFCVAQLEGHARNRTWAHAQARPRRKEAQGRPRASLPAGQLPLRRNTLGPSTPSLPPGFHMERRGCGGMFLILPLDCRGGGSRPTPTPAKGSGQTHSRTTQGPNRPPPPICQAGSGLTRLGLGVPKRSVFFPFCASHQFFDVIWQFAECQFWGRFGGGQETKCQAESRSY